MHQQSQIKLAKASTSNLFMEEVFIDISSITPGIFSADISKIYAWISQGTQLKVFFDRQGKTALTIIVAIYPLEGFYLKLS